MKKTAQDNPCSRRRFGLIRFDEFDSSIVVSRFFIFAAQEHSDFAIAHSQGSGHLMDVDVLCDHNSFKPSGSFPSLFFGQRHLRVGWGSECWSRIAEDIEGVKPSVGHYYLSSPSHIKGQIFYILSRNVMNFLWFLLIGAFIGWLAGVIVKGSGFGLLGNILVGIVGAMLGGWLFSLFGVSAGGPLGSLVVAVIGAIVLVGIAGMIRHS